VVVELKARVFEAVELSDGSIRIVMEIEEVAAGVAKVAVNKDIAHVAVSTRGRVRWEGIFHLPFAASSKTVSCSLKNSFIELVARPVSVCASE